MTLTIGSLFSGIGGLELGLERAGLGPVVWQVEKDEYCRAVLAKHWPNATRYEDVKDVGRANLVPVDVICGGFPCQDVSAAGRRAGVVAGTRSGLWYEFSRIIRDLRPRYVVVENVAALLTLGLDAVLGELAESGYDAEWDCVPALAVGAPHRRDRVFVVAYPNRRRWWSDASRRHNSAGQDAGRSQADGVLGAVRDSGASPDMADADGERELQPQGRVTDQRRWSGDRGSEGAMGDSAGSRLPHGASLAMERPKAFAQPERSGWWETEPDVGRVAHGVPARVDRLRALGNAVVPQVAEVVGRVIQALESERAA